LEEINEAIKNRPLPDWVIERTLLPIQPGEFTVADLSLQADVSLATARRWLAEWVGDGKLTRTQRKQADGHRVWAYKEMGNENQDC